MSINPDARPDARFEDSYRLMKDAVSRGDSDAKLYYAADVIHQVAEMANSKTLTDEKVFDVFNRACQIVQSGYTYNILRTYDYNNKHQYPAIPLSIKEDLNAVLKNVTVYDQTHPSGIYFDEDAKMLEKIFQKVNEKKFNSKDLKKLQERYPEYKDKGKELKEILASFKRCYDRQFASFRLNLGREENLRIKEEIASLDQQIKSLRCCLRDLWDEKKSLDDQMISLQKEGQLLQKEDQIKYEELNNKLEKVIEERQEVIKTQKNLVEKKEAYLKNKPVPGDDVRQEFDKMRKEYKIIFKPFPNDYYEYKATSQTPSEGESLMKSPVKLEKEKPDTSSIERSLKRLHRKSDKKEDAHLEDTDVSRLIARFVGYVPQTRQQQERLYLDDFIERANFSDQVQVPAKPGSASPSPSQSPSPSPPTIQSPSPASVEDSLKQEKDI